MKQLLILLCLPLLSLTQPPSPVLLDLSDAGTEQPTTVPYCAIEVMDVRFDKSNIGCVIENVTGNAFKHTKAAAIFPDSLHRYLPALLQKFIRLEKESKDTLLLLVKQFRLAERLIDEKNLHYEPELMLKISLSAFRLREARLTKIFSVDDLLSKSFPADRKPTDDFLQQRRPAMVMALLQIVFQNQSWAANGPTFSLSAVQESIRKRYQLPLFTDTVLQAGVYKNFQEFKQNNPSHTDVKFVTFKGKVIAVRDNKDKTIDLKTIWGICNGKKQFLVFRGELCELLPSDRSFRFFSSRQINGSVLSPTQGDYGSRAVVLGAQMIKSMITNGTPSKEYFYLNMDDEVVYLEELLGKSGLKALQTDLSK